MIMNYKQELRQTEEILRTFLDMNDGWSDLADLHIQELENRIDQLQKKLDRITLTEYNFLVEVQ